MKSKKVDYAKDKDSGDQFELHTVGVVSSGHVTESDARILDRLGSLNVVQTNVLDYGHGWRWYIGSSDGTYDERQQYAFDQGLSDAFLALIETLHGLGCVYAQIDCDGPAVSFLPFYNW